MTLTQEMAQEISPELKAIREEIHAHPELSYEEEHTAALVVRELQKIGGYQITEHVGGSHGVLAEISGPTPGKTVALRADMDALPINEETGAPFASQTANVMHACGHDMHTTILLGAAKLIRAHQDELKGTVRLIFQPAEEASPTGGSRIMIDAGATEGVDGIFGLHVWPDVPMGVIAAKHGAQMAASDHFYVTIKGKSSHAAQPELGIDALMTAARFIEGVQPLISREKSAFDPAVCTIGTIQGGTRYNVLMETVKLEGTVRTFNEETRDRMEKHLEDVLKGACLMNGATYEFDYRRGYMSLINTPAYVDFALDAARTQFGEEKVVMPPHGSTGGEDFAFYLKDTPGAFMMLGAGKEGEKAWPLHNPHVLPDGDLLWYGAYYMATLALTFSDNIDAYIGK